MNRAERAAEQLMARGGVYELVGASILFGYRQQVERADISRRLMDDLQDWQECITLAARAHDFPDWDSASAWFATVPKFIETAKERRQWLKDQRTAAGCHDGSPIIPVERQMEIAMRSLDQRRRSTVDDYLAPTTPTIVPKPDGGVRVNSGKSTGGRLSDTQLHMIRTLTAQNLTAAEIALRVGVSSRTVVRHRTSTTLTQSA